MAETTMNIGNKRPNRLRAAIWGTAAAVLLLPLVAMQFTGEVNWDATDFIAMGVMLVIACGAYEVAAAMTGSRARRAISGAAILACFLIIWVELAVGIFH